MVFEIVMIYGLLIFNLWSIIRIRKWNGRK